MTQSTGHPSRLELDTYLVSGAEGAEGDVAQHIETCRRCTSCLAEMRAADEAFLERMPALAVLGRAVKSRESRPEPVMSWGLRVGISLGLVGAAAAAVVAFVVLKPAKLIRPPGSVVVPRTGLGPGPGTGPGTGTGLGPGTVRIKGSSILEVAVKREGRSFPYSGQPLRSGDVLAFRYTTRRHHLMLLGVERSGKIFIYLADPDRLRSMAITPGKQVKMGRGIRLDDYAGPERFIALFTDDPLDVGAVRRAAEKRFNKLEGSGKIKLDLGRLPFGGDQVSWRVTRERR